MAQKRFLPLGDRVLIEPNEPASVSRGGIFLPDGAKDKPTVGKVVAVGPKVESPKLVPGAEVVYGLYSGHDVQAGDKTLKVVAEKDVMLAAEDVREDA